MCAHLLTVQLVVSHPLCQHSKTVCVWNNDTCGRWLQTAEWSLLLSLKHWCETSSLCCLWWLQSTKGVSGKDFDLVSLKNPEYWNISKTFFAGQKEMRWCMFLDPCKVNICNLAVGKKVNLIIVTLLFQTLHNPCLLIGYLFIYLWVNYTLSRSQVLNPDLILGGLLYWLTVVTVLTWLHKG